MDDQQPEGTVDLAALEAAGLVEIHMPGSPEEAAFHREMLAQLAAVDAETLERDGPDALTSARAFRLSQFKLAQAIEREAEIRHAEQDSDRIGFVLAAFRSQRGWSREQLADWLGITPDDFARLATEIRPRAVQYVPEPINEVADRHGAHRERLYEVFVRGDV